MTSLKPHNGSVGRSRAVVQLGPEIERRLRSYTMAAKASAVGVAGFLMLASMPSEAEVVYTPAYKTLGRGYNCASPAELDLDLNNDGQTDFILAIRFCRNYSGSRQSIYAGVYAFGAASSNQVMQTNQLEYQAALPVGAPIGSGGKFANSRSMAICETASSRQASGGPWENVTNRYLGLKFQIDGETHYGWARLNVTSGCYYTLTLTGYAYDTVANRPIVAGTIPYVNNSSDAEAPQMQPATLGALAAGSQAQSMWRGSK